MSKILNRFTVTKDHIKLLRSMFVSWNQMEYGAPTIDPKRPYGNSDVEVDICEILGLVSKYDEDDYPILTDDDLEYAKSIHDDMRNVLQIFLCTGHIIPGDYIKKSEYDDRSWINASRIEGEILCGDMVVYTGASDEQINWGANDDPRELLVENRIYIVCDVEKRSWHTKITLCQFPDKKFNSVSFKVTNKTR